MHRISLVVNRACRTRKVIDLVDFNVEGERDIVSDYFEAWVAKEVFDIFLRRGVVVVDTQHFVVAIQKALT